MTAIRRVTQPRGATLFSGDSRDAETVTAEALPWPSNARLSYSCGRLSYGPACMLLLYTVIECKTRPQQYTRNPLVGFDIKSRIYVYLI